MGEIFNQPNTEEGEPSSVIFERSGVTDRICPACQKEKLIYDHFLNLICPSCGYVEGSCFT